jgi:hypothetical protein
MECQLITGTSSESPSTHLRRRRQKFHSITAGALFARQIDEAGKKKGDARKLPSRRFERGMISGYARSASFVLERGVAARIPGPSCGSHPE